jgi:phosphotransferase system IIB component
MDNDYQVCIINTGSGRTSRYKVSVRRKGITTEGKDYKIVGGVRVESYYNEIDIEFKTKEEANEYLYELRDQLERDYHA